MTEPSHHTFLPVFFYPFCLYTRKYSSRSNPPEVLEKSVLKICIRFTGEHSCKHLQKAMTAKLKKRNWNPFFCESIMKRNIFLPFKYTNSFDCVLTNYWVCCSFILWLCDYREIILLEWKNFKVLTGVKVLIKYMKILIST